MKRRSINWDAISAIGTLISSAAVAMTLIYLTAQVRYAKIAASDANRLARSNGVVQFFLSAMHDPEFRRTSLQYGQGAAFIKEVSRRLEISEEEATQLNCSALYWFWLHWGQWSTTTQPRDLAELRGMVQRFYTQPHIRLIWEGQRRGLEPRFSSWVDEGIAEADADPALRRGEADFPVLLERLDGLGIGVLSENTD